MSDHRELRAAVALPREFYQPSAELVARRLLGHLLISKAGGKPCGGVIVETEAYLKGDPASHSYGGKTKRNTIMWGEPSFGYVYFIYGNHFCFNATCRPEGIPEAVLIRAIQPTFGEIEMAKRRAPASGLNLTNGPGKLCAALGINRSHDGLDICSADSPVFIAENPQLAAVRKELGPIVQTTRIGITKAAELPLRFYLEGSKYVSKRVGKTGS